jgi:haloalkane dehalogenase
MGELRELFLRTGAVTESRKLVIDENAYIEELLPLSIVRELTPDELDAYREPFTDPAARQAILRLRLSVGSVESRAIAADSLAWLNVTETPVLLLTATPGVIGTDRQVAWVRKTLPRVEIADIGEGLHLVQEDRPDEIAAAILEWMDAHDL